MQSDACNLVVALQHTMSVEFQFGEITGVQVYRPVLVHMLLQSSCRCAARLGFIPVERRPAAVDHSAHGTLCHLLQAFPSVHMFSALPAACMNCRAWQSYIGMVCSGSRPQHNKAGAQYSWLRLKLLS